MASEHVIRKMEHADVAQVFAIHKSVETDPWDEKLLSDCIDVGYECWVLTLADKVIGFGVLSYSINEAHILNLAITPHKQHLGYGRKILEHLLDLAVKRGVAEVWLEVRESNIPARKLYTKYNFVELGLRKDYYPSVNSIPAEDGIAMVLPLKPNS